MAAKLVRKKLKVDIEVISNDLENCANPVIRALNTVLCAGGNSNREKYQRKMVIELGQLLLWILYKDTAYRDCFFWMLYQLLKRADKLLKILEPYVKDPSEWTPNLWNHSKEETLRLKKEGKLPDYAKSMEETIFTPSIQDKRHKKILGEK